MKIHVSDTSTGNPITYENISAIEKYTISDEKYNEREGDQFYVFVVLVAENFNICYWH